MITYEMYTKKTADWQWSNPAQSVQIPALQEGRFAFHILHIDPI